jgi:hypothetical protein
VPPRTAKTLEITFFFALGYELPTTLQRQSNPSASRQSWVQLCLCTRTAHLILAFEQETTGKAGRREARSWGFARCAPRSTDRDKRFKSQARIFCSLPREYFWFWSSKNKNALSLPRRPSRLPAFLLIRSPRTARPADVSLELNFWALRGREQEQSCTLSCQFGQFVDAGAGQ